ncbi:hypothetical protein FH972_005624 [Carpinus fangiana]|uniref:Uncharacterized protein n=1 Tax=Carpinus fangiana TaxID=176857 RepID=A0A5N6QSQ4_9ROSI|nr:hypothetical protein FH972_005624 [Carpinus fangiana]
MERDQMEFHIFSFFDYGILGVGDLWEKTNHIIVWFRHWFKSQSHSLSLEKTPGAREAIEFFSTSAATAIAAVDTFLHFVYSSVAAKGPLAGRYGEGQSG